MSDIGTSSYEGRRLVQGSSDSLTIAHPHQSPSLAGYWTTSDRNFWYPMPKATRHVEPPLIFMHAAARCPSSHDLNSTTTSLLVMTSTRCCSVKCQHVSELDGQSSFKYEVTQPSSLQTSYLRQVGCNAKHRHELLQGRCCRDAAACTHHTCRHRATAAVQASPWNACASQSLPRNETSGYVYIRVFYLEHRESRIFAEGWNPLRKEPSRYELSSLALI